MIAPTINLLIGVRTIIVSLSYLSLSSLGWGWGDPHIVTFDGSNYTFNNLGEFTLLLLKDNTFTIQARTSLVTSDIRGSTKFTALAFQYITQKSVSKIVEIKVQI